MNIRPERLSDAFLTHEIKVQELQNFFHDADAFDLFEGKVYAKIEINNYTCDFCNKEAGKKPRTVLCEFCLRWFHQECVNAKINKKKSQDWFCKYYVENK